MAKETSITLKICDWFAKYSIYATIFLTPILFLPWTADVLDFNKQTALILLIFVALFAWMLRVLISGKFEINISKMHVVVGVLFLVSLLATLFSTNKYGSFWGWPQSSSESLLSLIGLVVFYFLVSNTFSKKNIFIGLLILSLSAFLAELIGVFQLFGLFIPLSFAKSTSFNTIGSVGSLGFFVALLLPLIMIMLIISKKWLKVLFAVQLILSALILFLVNYSIVWWVVIVASALVMVFGILKRNLFDGRWMALPMFFLAVSLFFILLNPQIPLVSQKANEVFLTQKSSLNLSLRAIKERPIFGSGPGTFAYNFLKFKDPNFSGSPLWNITFSQASSKVLNDLATTGILGLISLLAFMAFPIFYGVKFIVFEKSSVKREGDLSDEKETSKIYWIVILGILASLTANVLVYFLYNSSITISLLNFFLVAGLIGLVSSEKKEYQLKPSSFLTLAVTFIFTLVFIFGLGLLILDGQRYVAEANYYNAIASFQAGDRDAGTKNLTAAASINPSSDLYFRQLSLVYLSLFQLELKNTTATPSDTEKNKVQAYVASAINAAKMATNLNPKSSTDWVNLGYVYQSLYGLVGDTSAAAIDAYDQALSLDPNNPYLLSQEGAVNYVSAQALGQDKADQKAQLLSTAKDKLEKAINLKQDYAVALYFSGLVYDALGDKAKAIEEFKKVQQLDPNDTSISKILNNLNSGLPALQQTTPIAPTPPTTTDSSSANTTVQNPSVTPETTNDSTTPPKTAPKKTK